MNNLPIPHEPGPVVLFGSGETSPSGQKVFDRLLRQLPIASQIALLETPAGFEPNSDRVIGRVAEFLNLHLQNYSPQVTIIPARRRGTTYSPDNPQIVSPLLKADMIFLGPGSPSYAVRHLRDSLAWHLLVARHRLGAPLVLASAAAIALGCCALPVYEIYKVGEDLHWIDGLDFFSRYGLSLVFIPHWNNNEGGKELDTSRCFMGEARFTQLLYMLPHDITIIGIDEKTALVMDPSSGTCHVTGLGGVTLIHSGYTHSPMLPTTVAKARNEGLAEITDQRPTHMHYYHDGQSFPLSKLGSFRPYHPEAGLPPEIWQMALKAMHPPEPEVSPSPPEEVLLLVKQRETTRALQDWANADLLRQQINALGWQVIDTKEGPLVSKL